MDAWILNSGVRDAKKRGVKMLRIVTDTGSDITYLGAKEVGMEVVELDVKFDEFEYDYRNDLDFSTFYSNLVRAKNLPTTSQVTPAQYLDIFNDAKKKGDQVLVVTLSGGLSGTHSSAKMAEEECEYDGIAIIDSRQATCAVRLLAEYAVKLRDEGKPLAEVVQLTTAMRDRLGLVASLDTLTYLKKGGRIPPAMALIGNMMKVKPVIILDESGKIEPLEKVRGVAAAKKAIWTRFEADGFDPSYPVKFGYTNDKQRGTEFMTETVEKFKIKDYSIHPVGGVIGTHTGPGAFVVAYFKK